MLKVVNLQSLFPTAAWSPNPIKLSAVAITSLGAQMEGLRSAMVVTLMAIPTEPIGSIPTPLGLIERSRHQETMNIRS
jgi:hypothetical protein